MIFAIPMPVIILNIIILNLTRMNLINIYLNKRKEKIG